MRNLIFSTICAGLLTPLILLGISGVSAQVMESGTYRIQSDSINFGGGYSSSTNYQQESTFGEVGTGPATSTSYNLFAGYQQMQSVYISLAGGANVSMTPNIPGISGGEANGSTTVVVTTDSAAGYELTVQAENSPAMQKGADTIADYTPAGAAPDIAFITGAADAHLAYSPFGDDTVTRFQTNGSVCDIAGSASSTACWDGLSTSPAVIASAATGNQPAGASTTIYFRVGVGGSVGQPPGDYIATTTVTALPL